MSHLNQHTVGLCDALLVILRFPVMSPLVILRCPVMPSCYIEMPWDAPLVIILRCPVMPRLLYWDALRCPACYIEMPCDALLLYWNALRCPTCYIEMPWDVQPPPIYYNTILYWDSLWCSTCYIEMPCDALLVILTCPENSILDQHNVTVTTKQSLNQHWWPIYFSCIVIVLVIWHACPV